MSQRKAKRGARGEKTTIMLVSHSGKRPTLSISIPTITFKIFGGVLVVLTVAMALGTTYFSAAYKRVKSDAQELTLKAQECSYLQQQLNLFVKKTKDLEIKVKDIEKLDKDLRGLLQDEPELKEKLESDEDKRDSAIEDYLLDKSSTAVLSTHFRPTATIAHRGGIDRTQVLSELRKLEEQMPHQEESLKELKDAVIERGCRLACTPSIWPVGGGITSNFGYRRSPFGSRTEFHDGLDIGAPYGSQIAAGADGVVVFTGYVSGYGYTVRIDHGYGYETSYCHCSKILVKTGQSVEKGQGIAQVGSSGRSTGPHLHYMVKEKGVLKNPREYLN